MGKPDGDEGTAEEDDDGGDETEVPRCSVVDAETEDACPTVSLSLFLLLEPSKDSTSNDGLAALPLLLLLPKLPKSSLVEM